MVSTIKRSIKCKHMPKFSHWPFLPLFYHNFLTFLEQGKWSYPFLD